MPAGGRAKSEEASGGRGRTPGWQAWRPRTPRTGAATDGGACYWKLICKTMVSGPSVKVKFFSMGPYDYFWFRLENGHAARPEASLPESVTQIGRASCRERV